MKNIKKKKAPAQQEIFTCIVREYIDGEHSGKFLSTSFFLDSGKAIEYAERHYGIIRVIGSKSGIVWERKED